MHDLKFRGLLYGSFYVETHLAMPRDDFNDIKT